MTDLSISQYLQRVGSGNNNGYNKTDYVVQNNNTTSNNLPTNAYNKDGSINYDKLERFYKSRNNVREEMVGFNPTDNKVYSLSGTSEVFEWDHPIINNAIQFYEGIDKVQTSSSILSSSDIDKLLYHTLTPEYQDKMAEMLSQVEGQTLHEKLVNIFQHGSGIITSADYTDLNTAALNAQLITKTTKANTLATFFDTINTTDLIVPFEIFDPPTIQEDLGELEIPATVQGRYTSLNIGLKKDGYHLAWTRFMAGINRRRNVIQDNLNALSNDFGRVINERIAAVLATATSASGSSWSAFAGATDLRNQNNPLTIINSTRATLNGLGYPPEFSLSNLRVAQDYINSTYVRGALSAENSQMGSEQTMTLPMYGWRHGMDESLADSTFWLVNSNFASRVQGAVITITYTEQKSQVLGSIGYNWNNFAIKTLNAARRIISIT